MKFEISDFAVVARGFMSPLVGVVDLDGMVVHERDGGAGRIRGHRLRSILQRILLVIRSANLKLKLL